MRILTSCITLVLMLCTLSVSAEAQLLNRLKKKAKDAAAQKAEEKLSEAVERKAEQMVEKSWSNIFGEWDEDSTSFGFPSMFSMNSNVTTEEEYRFNTITTMEIKTIDKNGKSEPPILMKMHFNDNEMYTGTSYENEEMQKENGNVFIIYDFKNSAMIMLMSSDEDKFSFAYDWKQAMQMADKYQQEQEGAEDSEEEGQEMDEDEMWDGYSKIGTKNIAGYSCEGYRSENDQTVTEIWVTEEADFGMQRMFQANANTKYLRGKIPSDYPQGMMMAMESKNLDTGEQMLMQVTEVDQNANVSFSMSDYPTMSLGQQQKDD